MRLACLTLCFSLFGRAITAQDTAVVEDRVLLAISKKDYPVTPGDLYQLAYTTAGNRISELVRVPGDYLVNMKLFGSLNVRDMSLGRLKEAAERRAAAAYPNGMPELTLVSVGIFQVVLTGEVEQTRYITAWGMSRLSEITQGQLGKNASIRQVEIISESGARQAYDLYRAMRFGDADQDPYLRPGDTIVIRPKQRTVHIQGEVARPGSYQLLPGEGFQELVQRYGGGFSEFALRSRVKLERVVDGLPLARYLDLSRDYSQADQPVDEDRLTVLSVFDKLPSVTFEGAILSPDGAEVQAAGRRRYGRYTHRFTPGETLYDALVSIRKFVSGEANLADGQVIREGQEGPILVDMEQLLSSYDPEKDLVLQPNDRIFIPTQQAQPFSVQLIGAVNDPGFYPWVPGKTLDYYLNLADIYFPELNTEEYITIIGREGKVRKNDQVIEPEDRIFIAAPYVTVLGAVTNPGVYNYVPGRSSSYYLTLAGGIDPARNKADETTVFDSSGVLRDTEQIIQPGDRITALTNRFSYNFNQYFPIIATGVGFVLTFISLVNLLAGSQ